MMNFKKLNFLFIVIQISILLFSCEEDYAHRGKSYEYEKRRAEQITREMQQAQQRQVEKLKAEGDRIWNEHEEKGKKSIVPITKIRETSLPPINEEELRREFVPYQSENIKIDKGKKMILDLLENVKERYLAKDYSQFYMLFKKLESYISVYGPDKESQIYEDFINIKNNNFLHGFVYVQDKPVIHLNENSTKMFLKSSFKSTYISSLSMNDKNFYQVLFLMRLIDEVDPNLIYDLEEYVLNHDVSFFENEKLKTHLNQFKLLSIDINEWFVKSLVNYNLINNDLINYYINELKLMKVFNE